MLLYHEFISRSQPRSDPQAPTTNHQQKPHVELITRSKKMCPARARAPLDARAPTQKPTMSRDCGCISNKYYYSSGPRNSFTRGQPKKRQKPPRLRLRLSLRELLEARESYRDCGCDLRLGLGCPLRLRLLLRAVKLHYSVCVLLLEHPEGPCTARASHPSPGH